MAAFYACLRFGVAVEAAEDLLDFGFYVCELGFDLEKSDKYDCFRFCFVSGTAYVAYLIIVD